ncbi:BatD family protein [Flavihumibacter fluvii]|uniref:BatD family protein n=1 Tax=Flavihumibacter fluvii TaxID=2838157 RepID=UPI001BDE3693|nr:BatD family protein [Flavihumibacter fluvii]ULQ51123.1 BatD family protein [Flavihumibacter fluvii]
MDKVNRGIKILLAFTFVMAGQLLQAQAVRVKAASNKDHILVGEPVLLQLEAECPADASLTWFDLDSITNFEFIDRGKIDTLPGSMGKLFRQSITITSFDSGSQVIPQMAITINNSRFLTDSIKVEVGYSVADPNQPYHDIKDIIEVPAVEPLYINYIIAVLTVLAIVALVFLLKRKSSIREVVPVPTAAILPPFEQAMASLAFLRSAGLPEKGQFKSFHVQLNNILRDYCRGEKIGALPDSDNIHLVLDVKPLMQNEDLVELAQALRLSDAVKFARYQPTEQEHEQVYGAIRNSIEKINHQMHKKISP